MADSSNSRRRNNNNSFRRRNNNSNNDSNNNNRNRNHNNKCQNTQSVQNYDDNNRTYDVDSQSDNDRFNDSPSNRSSNNQYNTSQYSNKQYNDNQYNNSNHHNKNKNKNKKHGRGATYPGHEDDSRVNPNATAGATNKRRKISATLLKGQPRANVPQPQTKASSSLEESAINGPSAETIAAISATTNSTCQHAMCIELTQQGLQRTHADARCFRFTNPKRFESILRRRRRDGLLELSGDQDALPVAVSNAYNPYLTSALTASHKTGQQGQRKAHAEDDDQKLSDYLYMKDSSHYKKVGSPHPTTWRYVSDEGGEEFSCANNGGPVAVVFSGSTQTLAQVNAQKMSRSARQRARRAAKKAEAKSNSNNTTNVGGNDSSLNSSKQPPQILQQTHIIPACTFTINESRGLTWDENSETDEWDRPLNILEARDLLADMDRLNRESRLSSQTTKASTLPMDIFDEPQRIGFSMGTTRFSARPFSDQTDTVDLTKHAVSVHTGTPSVPMHLQQQQTMRSAFVGGFRGTKPGDNRIAVPVKINGVVLTALLASGRIKSCIDRKVAEAIGLRTWSDPALEMIDHYRTPKTMHTCNAINASYGNKTGKVILDVDDLNYYDFQIGIDLTHIFGFFPVGIKTTLQ
ncbi:hypothetical protein F5H01DRAFT_350700 [Linnemannia elongata]|nr:hypothetical protein F5H01DRAFT_350700 [Linnemannia elongata]